MMLLQIQNLHSESSKIRFEATNTLQTYETYAHKSGRGDISSKTSPYNHIPNSGREGVDTYKATRQLIAAGESIMQQNRSALDRMPRSGPYEPTKYI
jgi:hypothetical protein